MKKPRLWDRGVALADWVKNLIEKQMTRSVRQRYDLWRVKPSPWDRGMVTDV